MHYSVLSLNFCSFVNETVFLRCMTFISLIFNNLIHFITNVIYEKNMLRTTGRTIRKIDMNEVDAKYILNEIIYNKMEPKSMHTCNKLSITKVQTSRFRNTLCGYGYFTLRYNLTYLYNLYIFTLLVYG